MTTHDTNAGPRVHEEEIRHIATLNGAQATTLAKVCSGATPGTTLTIRSAGVPADATALVVETHTLLSTVSATGPVLRVSDGPAPLFTLTHAQAARLADFFSEPVDRMHLFAPVAVDGTAPALLLEVDAAGHPTCTWLLGANGDLAMPQCTPGSAITLSCDDPAYQVEAALCELYRFAPTAAIAFQPRFDAARGQCVELEYDDEARAEIYGVLTFEILQTLDERHPFRQLTCRAYVITPSSVGMGWGVRRTQMRTERDLTLVAQPA